MSIAIAPTARYDRSIRWPRLLGVLVGLMWIMAAAPDLAATFAGERLTNDVSFAPAWLKAVRDLATLVVVVYISRRTLRRCLLWRCLAIMFALGFCALGLARGISLPVAVRGVIWILPIVWAATADVKATQQLMSLARGILAIMIPFGIVTSLLLGFLGFGVYYESVWIYQRNPGLMLAPSATAFMACIAFLLAPQRDLRARLAALAMGALTISGVFFINALLLFGRLPRSVYLVVALSAVSALPLVGADRLIEISSVASGGIREGEAVGTTLSTRVLVIVESITGFTPAGNFPVGLNVAANQDIEVFFPDNAYLAVTYAFGVVGLALAIVFTLFTLFRCESGVFILLLTASMFYVWFENSLFACLVGLLLNSNLKSRVRSARSHP